MQMKVYLSLKQVQTLKIISNAKKIQPVHSGQEHKKVLMNFCPLRMMQNTWDGVENTTCKPGRYTDPHQPQEGTIALWLELNAIIT